MAAIAIVGVLAFLIFLVGRAMAQSRGSHPGSLAGRRYQYLLAALLVVVVIILCVWQFSTDGLLGQAADWRAEGRAITFFVIMLIVVALGLVGFVIYLIVHATRQGDDDQHDHEEGYGPAFGPPIRRLAQQAVGGELPDAKDNHHHHQQGGQKVLIPPPRQAARMAASGLRHGATDQEN
jgi:membrane protease YdiL (CAAX protease family)